MLNNFGEICRQKAQTWRENATTPTRQWNPLGFVNQPIVVVQNLGDNNGAAILEISSCLVCMMLNTTGKFLVFFDLQIDKVK